MQLPHTQKSRLHFMFLKSPPTIAARWMTWVGRCFSNTASVSSMFLRRGHNHKDWGKCRGSLWIVCIRTKTPVCILLVVSSMLLHEVGIFGGEEYPFFPFLGCPFLFDYMLHGPAHQTGSSCHQHPQWRGMFALTAHLEKQDSKPVTEE